MAWRARQPAREPATSAGIGAGEGVLALSAQNVGVVALGTALGTAAVQGGTVLWQQATQGGTPQEVLLAEVRALRAQVDRLVSPLGTGFLPDDVRALPGPVVPLQFGRTLLACVRVEYRGRVLYYHADRRLLLCEAPGGGYARVESATALARVLAERSKAALAVDPPDPDAFPSLRLREPSAAETAAEEAADAAFRAAMAEPWPPADPAPAPPAGKAPYPA